MPSSKIGILNLHCVMLPGIIQVRRKDAFPMDNHGNDTRTNNNGRSRQGHSQMTLIDQHNPAPARHINSDIGSLFSTYVSLLLNV